MLLIALNDLREPRSDTPAGIIKENVHESTQAQSKAKHT